MNQADPRYQRPVDDSLPIRDTGEWAKEKLWYIERFVAQFLTAMRGKPWRALQYIDLFSGPGKDLTGEGKIFLGSPLLAVTQENRFDAYFFADINKAYIDALRVRCSGISGIQYYVGDANSIVNRIANTIARLDNTFMPGLWPSLNLAVLDPEGLELKWSTVETLAGINRMDMIIYYPQMGITREAPKEIQDQPPTLIDEFFGDTEWRSIYKKYSHAERLHGLLVDHYKKKLRDHGYIVEKDLDITPVIRNRERRTPLYRLLFISKHQLGKKFWRNALQKDAHGQGRLF